MSARQIIRMRDNKLEWWIDRAYHEGVWVYRSRDEATRIAQRFRESAKGFPHFLEIAEQIEAAITLYDRENADVHNRTDQAA